jgi:hypothetical protein
MGALTTLGSVSPTEDRRKNWHFMSDPLVMSGLKKGVIVAIGAELTEGARPMTVTQKRRNGGTPLGYLGQAM